KGELKLGKVSLRVEEKRREAAMLLLRGDIAWDGQRNSQKTAVRVLVAHVGQRQEREVRSLAWRAPWCRSLVAADPFRRRAGAGLHDGAAEGFGQDQRTFQTQQSPVKTAQDDQVGRENRAPRRRKYWLRRAGLVALPSRQAGPEFGLVRGLELFEPILPGNTQPKRSAGSVGWHHVWLGRVFLDPHLHQRRRMAHRRD